MSKYRRIQRSITNDYGKAKPKNIKIAYWPPTTEFLLFCQSLYGMEDNPAHVMKEKSYGFISHQAHCTKYSSKNRKSRIDTSVQRFDRLDYDIAIILIRSFDYEADNWDHFCDVLDFDAVNQYRYVMKSILRE